MGISPAAPAASSNKSASFAASRSGLTLAALGVVFGDIGTSPLYAVKETFAGAHPLPIDRPHVLGALSLVFWTITLVVSVKYVAIMMRADNKGEGGSLALQALLERAVSSVSLRGTIALLGIIATALFYGDCMITPAISVLSAIEGLDVAAPALAHYTVPVTVVILIALFAIQPRGTGSIGRWFGPVMMLWFGILAIAGIAMILRRPEVMLALSPHYAILFIVNDGWTAFLSFGAVFLAVTGAEALYADMGHFGRRAVRLAWYGVALPGLILNYFGQGALLLNDPAAIDNPFYRLVPETFAMPMLVLAAAATVIASQAVISGAYSVTQQAVLLGYLPRLRTIHTSAEEQGQIYIPFVNWTLLVFVVVLVIGFETSNNLAAAYGFAVSGTMVLSTIMIAMVARYCWNWSNRRIVLTLGFLLVIDLVFLSANATKIPDGGWFPLAVAFTLYVLLTTWKKGRALLTAREAIKDLTIDDLAPSLKSVVGRVPSTAVFLTSDARGIPAALLHNLKHNMVIHERSVLLTAVVEDRPTVPDEERIEAADLGSGFRRLILHYGYRDLLDVPKTLANAKESALGFFYLPAGITYFISRETLVAVPGPEMSLWRKKLFVWMWRTAVNAMEFFNLPTNRVVEMGSQVKI